ncbi:MAG TPA: right-handed parallel beta-helix repeat-containing protein [Vicinamibacterales bacterium]|nr:right-handed parallel beta-helix repeat-containing protein [Vicinamibacterales bacterium]
MRVHPANRQRKFHTVAWTLLFLGVAVHPAFATDYYVSKTGHDNHPGTSVEAAWRTIQRVNSHQFFPGDRIFFEGGQTFSGNLYFDAADGGRASAPVVIGSYGSRRATIYAATGHGMLFYNTAGFRIENLYVVGAGRDSGPGTGIFFFTDLPGDVKLDGITIRDVDAVRFGDYGVLIGSWAGATGYRNVTIVSVKAGENRMGGIFTYAAQPNVHEQVYVGRSSAYLNSGQEGLLYNSGNGITLSSVNGGTIEHCVARENGWRSDAGNGPIGIWAYDSTRILLQFNESHHNRTGGRKDGGGFAFDRNTSHSVMQYNYSHDNAGSGYLLAHRPDNYVHTHNVIRYNISENDGRMNAYAGIHTWGRIRNAQIYNNTIYLADRGTATEIPRGIFIRNTSITLQDPENLHFRNNIIQTTGGVRLIEVDATALDGAIGLRFEGNAYFTTGGSFNIYWGTSWFGSLESWRSATGQERIGSTNTGLVADPRHRAPGRGMTFDDTTMLTGLWGYRLRGDSLLIDAGLDLRAMGLDVGRRDYYSGEVPYAHGRFDIGAHEYAGECHWSLSAASAAVAAGGTTAGTLSVFTNTTPCGWAAQSTVPWLGVWDGTASNGSATVRYWVTANTTGAPRTGTIRIADQVFTVTQAAGSGPAPGLPEGWQGSDIGAVGVPGSAAWSGGTYTVTGAGADVWGTADAFQFVWHQVRGDVDIVARVTSVEYVHAWTKAGVMIRQRLTADSPHAFMLVSPGKGLAFQRRAVAGGLSTHTSGGAGVAPAWVRLQRRGDTLTASRSADGVAWTVVGSDTIVMGQDVYVGLAVTSHDTTRTARATFDSVAVTVPAAPPPAPSPWRSQDLGAVGLAGSAVEDAGRFTVRASGADIWGAADGFHFVWQPLSGDAVITARVESVEYVHAWVKAGVMIRERLTADSPHAFMLVSAAKGLAFQRRLAAGGESTHTSGGAGTAPAWVRLERAGNTITAFRSDDGVSWTRIGSDSFTMGAEVYVGLALTSHDNTRLATATFANVTVTRR